MTQDTLDDLTAEHTATLDWNDELKIYATTPLERKKRARPLAAEPFTVAWLESNLRGGDVFYDVGANVGTFSLMAAYLMDQMEGEGTVFGFEPAFATYGRFSQNIHLNGLGPRVVPVPLLLGARTSLRSFAYRDMTPGQSRHRQLADGHGALSKRGRMVQRLMAFSLDDLLRLQEIPPPDLMKVDVDGGELDFVKGALATFRQSPLRSLIIEIDPEFEEEIFGLLTGAGLRLASRHSTGHRREVIYAVFDRP